MPKVKISADADKNWANNDIQFPRLIAEAEMAGLFNLNDERVIGLMESMDIDPELLSNIIDRAGEVWDDIKEQTRKRRK